MSLRALILPVEDDYWAADLDAVQEVLARPSLTRLPLAPPALLGVCNRRGEVLPVVSITALTREGRPPGDREREPPWVAVVDTSEGAAGLALTGAPQAVELGSPVGPGEGPGARSVHRWEIDGALVAVTLIDPLALVTAPRVAGGG